MLGERPDVITYTQCVSPLCTVRFRRRGRRTPEVCVGERRRWVVGGLLEKGWRQQQRMFIISHTRAHAQCYRHISPDSYDEPRQFMQKIVSFPQPHFSSNGFLSQFHPPRTPDICLPRIPPSSMSTFLWCSLSCSPPSSIPPSASIT